MKSLLAITFATVYGLALRFVFGAVGELMGVMTLGFLICVPVVIGFLTIKLLPQNVRNRWVAFFTPWLTSLVILIITMLFNIEGAICWMMIYPLFSILAGFGGIWAYNIRKRKEGDSRPDQPTILDWNNKDTLKTSFIMLLPIVIGLVEGDRSLSRKDFFISRDITIAAPPEKVWLALTAVNDIKPEERHAPFSVFMGFPAHLGTTLDTLAVGGNRKAVYENGLYFDEVISSYEKERSLVLDIHVDPNKIPPTVMDEHIIIGGRHVDIEQDSYTLQALPEGKTRLTLSSKFWINTPFNWYAGIWTKYLMNDILDGELELVKERTEK